LKLSENGGEQELTDLAYHLIVLQYAPCDVHAVVVPVRPWHLLVDICVDARHLAAGLLGKAQRKTDEGLLESLMSWVRDRGTVTERFAERWVTASEGKDCNPRKRTV
jgi:hypothetical protein